MSIPFSNTHYRIPRGFANLLEGLTREVLREQPKDIPNFAARYFTELLKKREESGLDPAEWGAALEDRYYNNHSFQHPEEKPLTARSEDVSSAGGLTSSIQEEGGRKLVEDSAPSAQTEDLSDRRKSVPLLESSEDAADSQPRPSSSQTAEHKQEEESDADTLLRDQSATVIQAAFRGHQARDGVRKLKEEPGKNNGFFERDAETPQVDSTAPQDGNIETRSLPDGDAAKDDPTDGGTIQDKDLEAHARQIQEKEEQKEDDSENLIKDEQQIQEEKDNLPSTEDVKDQDHREEDDEDNLAITEDVKDQDCREADGDNLAATENVNDQDHREADEDNLATTENVNDQDHREEADEDNLATTENVNDQDHREEADEDNLATTENVNDQDHREEADEDNLATTKDIEGQGHRPESKEANLATQEVMEGQDHRVEAKEGNLDITEDDGDGKGEIIESQGLDACGGRSSERPDSSITQEDHSHEAKMTEEQRESADNQDNETKERPEAKEEEPADITTPREQHEGREDPREESEALRKQAEEALDIALDDPDANAAAAKIQAGFRGHMTRKKMKSGDKDVKHKEGKEGTSAQGEHEGD